MESAGTVDLRLIFVGHCCNAMPLETLHGLMEPADQSGDEPGARTVMTAREGGRNVMRDTGARPLS